MRGPSAAEAGWVPGFYVGVKTATHKATACDGRRAYNGWCLRYDRGDFMEGRIGCLRLRSCMRPASEGEPYTEKVVEATACDGRRPYNAGDGGMTRVFRAG